MGLTVSKCVLIVWPKIFQMSAEVQKFGIFEKKLSLRVRSPCMKSLSSQGPRDLCAKVKFHQRTINKTLFGTQSFFCSAKVQAAKMKSYDFFQNLLLFLDTVLIHTSDSMLKYSTLLCSYLMIM